MRRTQFFAVLASTAFWLFFPAIRAQGQAAPAQFFWVCYSGANQPNVYVSGVLQGPATAAAAFQVGFAQVLMQKYSYQGNARCVPSRTAINAQDDMNRRMAALRNAKKNVVETGWTETAPAAPAAAAPRGVQPAKAQTQAGGNPSGAQGASSTGSSTAASVLATLFSTPAGAGAGSGSAAGGAKAPSGQAAGKTDAGSGGGGGANTGAITQVGSTLSSIFGKGSSGSAPGAGGNAAGAETPANGKAGRSAGGGAAPAAAAAPSANTPGGGLPQGALGSAQFENTMLVVYGCGRQGSGGTQVLCVTDLTNQNTKDTLVQSANVWRDAFIVDDRGDRHRRTNCFFLNLDGEQRQQLDIDYGKNAHFILAFDGVPAKVEKIELRSATGGLNVKGISLVAVEGASASGQTQPAAH